MENADSDDLSVVPLSACLYDVPEMCGAGVWLAELQQLMPPRSLDESLRSPLAMGLIETV